MISELPTDKATIHYPSRSNNTALKQTTTQHPNKQQPPLSTASWQPTCLVPQSITPSYNLQNVLLRLRFPKLLPRVNPIHLPISKPFNSCQYPFRLLHKLKIVSVSTHTTRPTQPPESRLAHVLDRPGASCSSSQASSLSTERPCVCTAARLCLGAVRGTRVLRAWRTTKRGRLRETW